MAEGMTTYVCSMCGVTSKDHKNWGPICKRTGERVCDVCCWHCEYHRAWSGIWRCDFVTYEERMARARKRSADTLHSENLRITRAHEAKRRDFLRQRAIKEAGMRKKYQRENSTQ